MAKQFSFTRAEKLKSRKQVQELFSNGKSISAFPIRAYYKFIPAEGESPVMQVGVTVSKKFFKKAIDRNRIKRLLREAYRLQKKELNELLKEKGMKGHAFFIFVDKTLPTYQAVFTTMTKCLRTLQKKAAQTNESTT